MTDTPSSSDTDDAPEVDDESESKPPNGPPPGPVGVGAGLIREAVLAWVGLLVMLAGLNGWWFFLHGGVVDGYSFLSFLRDLLYTFAGVYLLFVAVGSAADRLHRRRE